MNRNIVRQVKISKRCERKYLQDIHKPMVIANKKKENDKKKCRISCKRRYAL